LTIDTNGHGLKLVGKNFTIHSGGLVEADNLQVEAEMLMVEDSAYITADKQVFNIIVTYAIFYRNLVY
jgi:hypothetical protein